MEENEEKDGSDEDESGEGDDESGDDDEGDEGEADVGSEKGEGDNANVEESASTEQAQQQPEPAPVETQPTVATPEAVVAPVISQDISAAAVATPEPVVEEEIVEEVEEEEVMEPEVVPDFLKNAEWAPAKPEDFEFFEYEPLVEPIRRMSELELITEEERDAEWMTNRKENRPPVILTHLSDRVVAPGSTLKLTLSAEGPGVTVNWLKNEDPIDKSPRITTSVNCGLYTLTITEVTRKDKGVYTAQVKNRLETLETSAKVTVISLPKEKKVKPFFVKIRDFYHIKLNCLIVEAQVLGTPAPTLTWYKDDVVVDMDERTRVEVEEDDLYQLLFHDPEPSDSGVYRCVARNSAGKAAIEHEVVFDAKIPNMHLIGMHYAPRKMLTEEEQAAMIAHEKEIKRLAAERVAEDFRRIQEILDEEDKQRHPERFPSTTPVPAEPEEGEPKPEGEGVEGGEEAPEEAPKAAAPRREKKKEPSVVEEYVEESIAIRLSKMKLKWCCELTSRAAPEDGSVKFQCVCEGPNSTFKWFKDGKPVEWGERFRNLSQMGIGEVVINKLSKKDAGIYTCIAKNTSGEISTSARLIVLPKKQSETSPPTFPRGIKENYSILKDELIIEAAVRGIPKPKISWKKDDEPIKADDRLTFDTDKDDVYQIIIHRPVAEDSGKYSCFAVSSSGKAQTSHYVNFVNKCESGRATGVFHKASVVMPEDPSLEEIIHPPKKEVPKPPPQPEVAAPAPVEGAEGAVEGAVEGEQPAAPAEGAPEDAAAPAAAPAAKAAPVKKEFKAGGGGGVTAGAINQLKFTYPLKDQVAIEGATIKLLCYIEGPGPQAKWFKNGKPLSWTTTIKNLSRDVYGAVEISKITLADAGEYTCTAKNSYNEISTSCNVKVLKNPAKQADPTLIPPTFTRVVDHYEIQTDDIILEVQIRGNPTPVLTWIRDGQAVKNDDKYLIQRLPDGVYRLYVHNPTRMDEGFYTIKAKNKAGEMQLKHKVEFLGKEHYQHVPLVLKMIPGPQEEEEQTAAEQELPPVSAEEATPAPAPVAAPAPPPAPVSTDAPAPAEDGTAEPQEGEPAPEAPAKKDPTRWERMAPTKVDKMDVKHLLTFETKLRNITAPEGTNVKLVCTVAGNSPTFKWFCEGRPVEFSNRIKNFAKLGIASVELLNASPKDSGLWKVVVDNGKCTVESECKVVIFETGEAKVPPTFTRLVKEYYNQAVDDIVLEVHLRGVPRPTITWLKDCLDVSNEEYFPPGKYIIERAREGVWRLCIHNPVRQDSGRYVCEASNSAGKEEIRYQLNVKPTSDYTHVRGIAYADPRQKKNYDDEPELEPPKPKPKPIEPEPVAQPPPPPPPAPKPEPADAPADGDAAAPVEGGEPVDGEVPFNTEGLSPEEIEMQRVLSQTPPELMDRTCTDIKYALNFIAKLKNQMGVEGGSSRFVCSIDGYRPELKWYKNNLPVNFDSNIKNITKDTICGIQFSKLKLSDAGVYKCVATNKFGQISTWAYLRVVPNPSMQTGSPPQFLRVRDWYDVPTNQIIVEVRILGTEPFEVLWYKDCREVYTNDKYLLGREPGGVYKCYVANPVRRDSGTYMVKVTNAFGFEQTKHEVNFWDKEEYFHVHGISHADPKQKRKHIELVKLPKKEEMSEEDKRQVQHRDRPEILALEPPVPKTQEEKDEEKKKSRTKVPEPITFVTKLRNQMVATGSNVKLSCCISDNNRVEATWLKNDEPIELDSRIKINLNKESANATLEIAKVTLEDIGTYKCQFKTKIGEIEGSCTVNVFEVDESVPTDVPPTLLTPIKDYYRHMTNDIVIECRIRGNPRPKVTWRRDGLLVDHCDKYEPYHMEDGTVMLVVNKPKMIDAGKYYMFLKNRVKTVEIMHELDYDMVVPEEYRRIFDEPKRQKHWGDIVVENEVHPRVYPKPKEPTPPPPEPEVKPEEEAKPEGEEDWTTTDVPEEEKEEEEEE